MICFIRCVFEIKRGDILMLFQIGERITGPYEYSLMEINFAFNHYHRTNREVIASRRVILFGDNYGEASYVTGY